MSCVLRLVRPAPEELDYRRSLLADPATMSYNAKWGGTVSFPTERWAEWYQKWVQTDDKTYFYRYLYAEDAKGFVGEAAYHYDAEYRAHMVSIIIEGRRRGRGYGREGLRLLMEAAKTNGVAKLCDSIAIDNPAIALFLSMGFAETWRNGDVIMLERML